MILNSAAPVILILILSMNDTDDAIRNKFRMKFSQTEMLVSRIVAWETLAASFEV